MNATDKILLGKLRAALKRHGIDLKVNAGMASCCQHVEKIQGKPLSTTPAMRSQELNGFALRGISDGMPLRPFKPLVGYQAAIDRRRRLCEETR